jgi:hypothetical protein
MDDCHELEEEMPPEDAVVTDVEPCTFESKHLTVLVVARPTRYLEVDASDGSGRLSWDNSMERMMYQCQIC